jgi:penicillin amidase
MSIGLSSNMQNELRRVSLLTELTPDELSQFWPNYPGDEPLKMPPLSDLYPTMDRSKSLANLDLPDFGSIEASNNWVVDGSRTKSGKPLLANDPHLAFSAPSIWYLAHLALPQGNVVGGTLPGFPTIVIGRTDQIAWGFTNTGTDVQDLYLEKINPDNANEYLTPEGWQSFKTRTETIKVRFAKDVEITVQETRHGPVLPPNPDDEIGFPPPRHALSMAWMGLSEKDRGLDAFLDAASATSFKAFIDALEPIAAPMQNVVYADMSGTIGYLAPGMVPLRGKEHQTKGLIPAPGWREINDWQGIIPYDELPRITNPDSGIIATANHKITPPGYPHHLTFDWGMPYRADRIYQLLDQSNSHDAESFADIQIDNTSQFAQQILPLLLTIETDHGLGQAAYSLLADWDGHLQADRPEGLIFSAWVLELSQQIFSDDIGDLSEQIRRGHPHFLIQILQDPSSNAKWCDNLATEESQETCQHVLKTSFESALEHLAKTYGADIQSWRWGKAHKIVHRHRPFDLIPLVRGFYNVEVESGGGPYTPNQGNYYGRGKSPFTNRHGAGYRAIYDFDDLDNSLYIQTTGQSGNVLSPHYDDFAPLWQQGKLIKIPTQRSEVEKSLMIQTKLLPQVP